MNSIKNQMNKKNITLSAILYGIIIFFNNPSYAVTYQEIQTDTLH